MASNESRRISPLLVLWAVAVAVTFAFSGAKLHYLIIDRLFDSLSLRFSADDSPKFAPSEDGVIREATMRPENGSADKFVASQVLAVHFKYNRSLAE